MIEGTRVVAVIPARGGSKSVPRKNVQSLAGRPLVAWTIDTAKATEGLDRIIVSTDDPAIAAIAEENGVEVYERPEHLATDQSLVIDAIKELIRRLRAEGETAEVMTVLEPTSPLRSPDDVRACLKELVAGGHDSVATFTSAELNPHRAWKIEGRTPRPFIAGAVPWLPRQELPQAYQLNGAVYAFRIRGVETEERALLFGRCAAVVMPRERSIDIDDPMDFDRVEAILKRRT